jgi:hypothetical protein
VDREFLKEIEGWRDSLASNIAVRNPKLTVDEMNFAVQQTIDRVIFLRICEDRGIEPYGSLQALLNGANTYRRLFELFYQADTKYNSGLFDFSADKLTPEIKIDDDVLKGIIDSLYYPKSPYEFSVLGADILGNVYEQFLGKVIRLTPSHQAKVEEKPEVKKAGGVYYTPEYIVEYIVQNTVGRLLEGDSSPSPHAIQTPSPLTGEGWGGGDRKKGGKSGLTPKSVSILRILDPACGSGSFLIGAYQYLLNYHLKWYIENNPEKYAKGKSPAVYKSGEGWRLTTQEKKRILLNNIFGVDIDRQAVEVTKLSLLLKVLEDENRETIGKNLLLFHERVLPNLDNNIKCGNSLIGTDFYSENLPLLSSHRGREKTPSPLASQTPSPLMGEGRGGGEDELLKKLNPFDWHDTEKGFGKIMKEGGFDAVIGNPPYVRQEMLGEFKPYLQNNYKAYHGMADIYVYFIEKAVSLLKDGGQFSYIVANKWMRANYGEPIRKWMKSQAIEEITDFGDLPVFQNATTYPCILRIGKSSTKSAKTFRATKVETLDFQDLQKYVESKSYSVRRDTLDDSGWSLASAKEDTLLSKIKSSGVPLGEYVKGKIYRGILTGLNEAFVIDEETRKRLIKEDPKSKELIKPFLAGRDVKRYQTPTSNKYLIFTRRGVDIKQYPAIEQYLSQYKAQLMPKPKNWSGTNWKGRKPGSYKWYEIQDAVDYYSEFEKLKIVIPAIVSGASYTFDDKAFYSNDKTSIISIDDKYLLGLLNSKVLDFFMHRISSTKQGGYYEYKPMYLSQLPICTIDFNNKKEKAMHDQMVSLVDKMIDLHEKLKKAKTPHDRELIERQIKAADSQIDKLVYELYGLTEEEMEIVEGKMCGLCPSKKVD